MDDRMNTEERVVLARMHLYNQAVPCGARAVRRHLQESDPGLPVPSLRRIGRLLTLYGLTHGRTGWYDGEDLDWLPAPARVPEEQRRHLSREGNPGP